MWVFSRIGFLSIVQKEGSNDPNALLCVRARFREDIEGFVEEVQRITSEDVGPYHETPQNDYAFRVFLQRPLVMEVVTNLIATLDASNFKESVHGNPIRDEAYYLCWEALYEAQQQARRKS